MKQLQLIFFMLLIIPNLYGQSFHANCGFGIGSYAMNDLKSFQSELFNNSTLAYSTTENFPPHYQSYIHFNLVYDNFFTGIKLSFQSTGARTIYSDYSGEHHIDQIINGFEFGLFYNYYLFESTKSIFYFGLQANAILSKLKIIEEISFYEYALSDRSESTGNSIGLNIGGQVGYRYSINKFFLGTELCYIINPINSALKFDGQKSDLKADWSGYRATITIGFKFD